MLGREALVSAADQLAANLLPLIRAIQGTGAGTLEAITCALNERGRASDARQPLVCVPSREPAGACADVRQCGQLTALL